MWKIFFVFCRDSVRHSEKLALFLMLFISASHPCCGRWKFCLSFQAYAYLSHPVKFRSKMKLLSSLLLLKIISWLEPSHSFFCRCRENNVIANLHYTVHIVRYNGSGNIKFIGDLLMSLSMSKDVCGSRPELALSQNRYFGLSTMARDPYLFFMPPLISAGNFCAHLQINSRKYFVHFSSCPYSCLWKHVKRNITFCSTVIESNNADPWNNMPICWRRNTLFIRHRYHAFATEKISPWSGLKRPTIHLWVQFSAATGADDEVAFAGFHYSADIFWHYLVAKRFVYIFISIMKFQIETEINSFILKSADAFALMFFQAYHLLQPVRQHKLTQQPMP